MFGMSNFKSSKSQASAPKISDSKGRANGLESLVRTALTNGELAPGVAAQVSRYRNGKLSCEDRRILAILDDAIAEGCVVCIEVPMAEARRQMTYHVG